MPDVNPLRTDEIPELRKYFARPTGQWNVGDALACVSAVCNLLPRLLDEVERTRALLRRIEWGAEYFYDYDASVEACPCCEGANPSQGTDAQMKPEQIGHKPGCELAALLGGEG